MQTLLENCWCYFLTANYPMQNESQTKTLHTEQKSTDWPEKCCFRHRLDTFLVFQVASVPAKLLPSVTAICVLHCENINCRNFLWPMQ